MSRMLEALLRLERRSESLNFADEVRRVLQEPDHAAQSTLPAAKVESFDAMRWQAEPIPNLSRETTNVLVARAFDAAMVLIGFGIFLGPWVFVRGTLTLGSQNAPILAVAVALLVFFYWFVWALADRDTPGTCFAKREVVDLEERAPQAEPSCLRRLNELEDENRRLRQMLADLTRDKEVLM